MVSSSWDAVAFKGPVFLVARVAAKIPLLPRVRKAGLEIALGRPEISGNNVDCVSKPGSCWQREQSGEKRTEE
jgi:hypothetical protein